MKTKLIVLTALGNIFIGLGIAICNLTGFGIDPFTSMTTGLSTLLGVGLGVFQMSLNIILYTPVLYLNRKAFGIGALINLFLLGYNVQYIGVFFTAVGITPALLAPNMIVRLLVTVIGILVLCFGCALYMDCDLGVSPYDGIAPLIDEKTNGKIPFKYARICTDILCMIIGFVSGLIGHITTAGLTTVFVAFGTGPVIDWYQKNITYRFTGKTPEK